MTAKRKKPQDPLQRLKNQIRGAANPRVVVAALRSGGDPAHFSPMIRWLLEQPALSRRIFHPPSPRSLRDLKQHPVLPEVDLDRDVRWAFAYVSHHDELIGTFVALRREYSAQVMGGHPDAALRVLDAIEAECGQSLWLIRNRVSTLQVAGGLERQKQYVAQIRRETAPNSIPPFVAYYLSIANEPTVTRARYLDQVDQVLRDGRIATHFAGYLRFHIAREPAVSSPAVSGILQHEQAGAAIDLYEALLYCARSAVAGLADGVSVRLRNTMPSLLKRWDDPRIGAILLGLGETDYAPPVGKDWEALLGATLRGDSGGAVTSALAALDYSGDDPGMLGLIARSRAISGYEPPSPEPGLSAEIVRMLSGLMRTAADADEAVSGLGKLALTFAGEAWADELTSYVQVERSAEPLEYQRAALRATANGCWSLTVRQLRAAALPEVRDTIYLALAASLTDATVGAYARLNAQKPITGEFDFDDAELALVNAEVAIAQGDFTQALTCGELLALNENAYFYGRGLRIRTHCLLQLGRVAECCRLVGRTIAKDWSTYRIVPLSNLVEVISAADLEVLRGSLALSIVYDMYATEISPAHEYRVPFSCEAFLDAHHLQRPSDLRGVVSEFDHDEVVYFLHHVCVPAVLDRDVGRFDGSKAIGDERVAICRLLIEIDPLNAQEYEAEIQSWFSKLLVRRTLRAIEESKIVIDEDGVFASVDSRLRESYERYIAFLRNGVGDTAVNVDPQGGVDRRLSSVVGIVGLPLPTDEVADLFKTLVLGIRDEFVSNTTHGLDGVLSTGIRHGTLMGELRSPVEGTHLVVPRDSAMDAYPVNEYWASRLGPADATTAATIKAALATFAGAFDDLVREIRTEWIQVRRLPGDVGLFDFTIADADVARIAGSVGPDTTFEEFVIHVLLLLEGSLDAMLQRVREVLETVAKLKIESLLTDLHEAIAELPNAVDRSELTNAIAEARTAFQLAFDRVGGWFYRGGPRVYDPFTLHEAMKVAEAALEATSRHLTVSYSTKNDPDLVIQGRMLPHLVNVFSIVFDNVVQHSGLPSPYRVAGEITRDDDDIVCRFTSEVHTDRVTVARQQALEEIRLKLRDGRYTAAAIGEGGSGLCKIGKVISRGAGTVPPLTFGFTDDGRFEVDIRLPLAFLDAQQGDRSCAS